MSREIKFRAWCERDKTMYQEIGLHPFISQDHTNADEDSPEYVPESAGKGLFTLWPNDSSWPIMQYTGLKDKNGVEIYEGDIVKTDYYSGTPGDFKRLIGVIKYHRCSFMVDGIKKYEWLRKELHGNTEVIGNIHQNPELS